MSDVLLEAKNLTIQFGGLKAVSDLNLVLKKSVGRINWSQWGW